jgi:hypothetical protein
MIMATMPVRKNTTSLMSAAGGSVRSSAAGQQRSRVVMVCVPPGVVWDGAGVACGMLAGTHKRAEPCKGDKSRTDDDTGRRHEAGVVALLLMSSLLVAVCSPSGSNEGRRKTS